MDPNESCFSQWDKAQSVAIPAGLHGDGKGAQDSALGCSLCLAVAGTGTEGTQLLLTRERWLAGQHC